MAKQKRTQRTSGAQQRRNWSEAEARRVLKEQEQSGESLTAFARRQGLRPQRLWWWNKQLAGPRPARSAHDAQAGTSAFVPVVVRAPAPQTLVAIELPGGVRLELSTLDPASAHWVAHLSQALGGG